MITSESKRARDLAEARLNRPVQDSLEAAIVLEAWAGESPIDALELGPGVVRADNNQSDSDGSHRPDRTVPNSLLGGFGLVVAIVMIASWAAPIANALGPRTWEATLKLALPISLGFEWLLLTRFPSHENGLEVHPRELTASLLMLLGAMSALATFGAHEQLAGALVITWVCGAVLIMRGWSAAYVVIVLSVTLALHGGTAPIGTLALSAATAFAATIAAIWTATPSYVSPATWVRTLGGALIGTGLGLMLVFDKSVGWGFNGSVPAIALIPSAVGSLWGCYHLSMLFSTVPSSLTKVAATHADRVDLRGATLRTLNGALMRLFMATIVLSAACVVLGRWTSGTVTISLFAAFGMFGLATMLVTLLVTIRRTGLATLAVICGLVLEFTLESIFTHGRPGLFLLAGSGMVEIIVIPPVVFLFSRPGRTLATGLWL